MPLDPLLANPTTFKFADPLEQYTNALQAQHLQMEINKARRGEDEASALNDAYKMPGAVGPGGALNDDVVVNALAQKGRGSVILAYQKNRADIKKAEAETGKMSADVVKTKTEATAKELDNMRSLLAGVSYDPAMGQPQMFNFFQSFAKNPVLQDWLTHMGTTPDAYLRDNTSEMMKASTSPEAFQQYVQKHQMGVDKTLENVVHVLDRGGMGQTVVSTNKYGKPNMQELGTYSSTSKAPSVSIDNRAMGKFEDKMMEQAAGNYDKMQLSARNAQNLYNNAQRIIDIVKSGKAYTGTGANAKMNAAAFLTALGVTGFKDEAEASQVLDKLMNANVFTAVGQFKNGEGVPMNRLTNLDLTLTKDATAKQNMTPEAIIEVMKESQELARRAVLTHNQRYNEMMSTPELAKGLRMSGARSFDIPGIPKEVLNALRQHPEKAAGFDKAYDLPPGTGASIVGGGGGGTPNGDIPFTP